MRYNRLKLSTPDFSKLKGKTAAVIGCGSLGSKTARSLARYGINLIIIDFDKVSEENLGTQEYCEKDVGELKVVSLEKQLKSINSSVKIKAIAGKFSEKMIKEANIVVDCTDNIKTRHEINDACKNARVPWVYGSVEKNQGITATFFRDYWFEKLVGITAKTSKVKEAGVSLEITAIISALQVRQAVKALVGKPEERIIIIDLDKACFDALENPFA